MRRYFTGIVATVLAAAVLVGTVLAAPEIRVTVNGNYVNLPVVPQVINDRVIVPVRAIAEALNAKVEWNPDERVVSITDGENSGMKQRISQLERALQPMTPDQAATVYADGVKARNGAQQYAVLSPELRQSMGKDFESMNWVTGTSSPWVETYQLSEGKLVAAGLYEYELKISWMTSTGPAGSNVQRLNVGAYHMTTDGFAPGAGDARETRYFVSTIHELR